MPHKAPNWWYKPVSLIALATAPLGALYGLGVKLRWATTEAYHSKLPVICIGNFTVGGAGKTPTALYLADYLKQKGHQPVFLTRGYGGRIKGPHLVTLENGAQDVGDEPLLLCQKAPCVVSADRPAGAQFIESLNSVAPTHIIMDDGFQNPRLHKDLNIVVVDGGVGVGNGLVFPAGPLRAPLGFQKKHASLVVCIGEQGENAQKLQIPCPVLQASLRPQKTEIDLADKSVIAYCGIARPEKFYQTLKELGAVIEEQYSFADHHEFTVEDVDKLVRRSQETEAQLVTTEKDWVRLEDNRLPFATLKKLSKTIRITLEFSSHDLAILDQHLQF